MRTGHEEDEQTLGDALLVGTGRRVRLLALASIQSPAVLWLIMRSSILGEATVK